MKLFRIVAVSLGLVTANFVGAQEVLTLQQALKYALEHKADAQKAKLEIENADYKIAETRGGALPQITGTGGLTYNPLIQENVITMGGQSQVLKFGQPWQATSNVTVNQQIFNQALFTGLKAAKNTREFYQINAALTDEQLIEKVAESYYQIFQVQLKLKTVETNLANTSKTRDVIKGLVDAGLGKKIDLDRMEVAINNLKATRQQLINSSALAENALKFAMGMDIRNKITLPEETFDMDASILVGDPDVEQRTEIRLLRKQVQLLELNKKAQQAEFYPTLSFSGNIGYMAIAEKFPLFNQSANKSPFSAVGLNLNIPIFKGGSTKAKVNQADVDIRKVKVDIQDTKLALQLANENAKSQIKNSLLTVESNKRNVEMAKDVLDNTQNNYRNGLATLTDLLDAEQSYADAQNNLTTSQLDYKIAEVQVIKSNGQLKSLVNE